MAKAMPLILSCLLACFSVVFSQDLQTLPPSYPHPTTPPPLHPPAHAPHHHHHHHSPAPAPALVPVHPPSPSVKPPTHPHYPPAPSKPPTHPHYPPSPAPSTPPTHHHPPSPAPSNPPTHHHPPSKPPTHPHYPPVPVKPPVPSPVHPPSSPVHPFPRRFVAVQGVVYVKSCKYAGVDTLLQAAPLLGAAVKLQCNNTRYKLVQTAKTDKNGYFFIEAPKSITTYGAHKCNVVLLNAPNGLKASNLHGGVNGAVLRPEKPFVHDKLPFLLYTVGPLAFEPKCY